MNLLAASGDVGGARAIAPVLFSAAQKNGMSVNVVDNGFIYSENKELNVPWNWTSSISNPKLLIEKLKPDVFLFATSLSDTLALEWAKIALELGCPTVHVLDNWASYTERLTLPDGEIILPDIYAVMDNTAKKAAEIAGIPRDIISVTGTPALETIDVIDRSKHSPSRVAFISEPVSKDQGTSPTNLRYRGYTEQSVLISLLGALNERADASSLEFIILPHPRDDENNLEELWQSNKGKLQGYVAGKEQAIKVLSTSHAAIGMSSILVLKSWLSELPVLSYQPNLRLQELTYLDNRPGLSFVTDTADIRHQIDLLLSKDRICGEHSKCASAERSLHTDAVSKILKCLNTVAYGLA